MAKNPSLTQDKLDILAQIPESIIEQLSAGVQTQADLHAIILGLKSRIIESALNGEITSHLSNPTLDEEGEALYNRRNGFTRKTVKRASGDIPIQVPRDRNSEFEPLLIQKHKRRLEGIDDACVSSLCSRDVDA